MLSSNHRDHAKWYLQWYYSAVTTRRCFHAFFGLSSSHTHGPSWDGGGGTLCVIQCLDRVTFFVHNSSLILPHHHHPPPHQMPHGNNTVFSLPRYMSCLLSGRGFSLGKRRGVRLPDFLRTVRTFSWSKEEECQMMIDICLCVCQSMYLSVSLCICLSVCQSICVCLYFLSGGFAHLSSCSCSGSHPAPHYCFQVPFLRLGFVKQKDSAGMEHRWQGNDEGNDDGQFLRYVSYPSTNTYCMYGVRGTLDFLLPTPPPPHQSSVTARELNSLSYSPACQSLQSQPS